MPSCLHVPLPHPLNAFGVHLGKILLCTWTEKNYFITLRLLLMKYFFFSYSRNPLYALDLWSYNSGYKRIIFKKKFLKKAQKKNRALKFEKHTNHEKRKINFFPYLPSHNFCPKFTIFCLHLKENMLVENRPDIVLIDYP